MKRAKVTVNCALALSGYHIKMHRSHSPPIRATSTGLFGTLQLATLVDGVLPIPPNLSVAIEIGASDRGRSSCTAPTCSAVRHPIAACRSAAFTIAMVLHLPRPRGRAGAR